MLVDIHDLALPVVEEKSIAQIVDHLANILVTVAHVAPSLGDHSLHAGYASRKLPEKSDRQSSGEQADQHRNEWLPGSIFAEVGCRGEAFHRPLRVGDLNTTCLAHLAKGGFREPLQRPPDTVGSWLRSASSVNGHRPVSIRLGGNVDVDSDWKVLVHRRFHHRVDADDAQHEAVQLGLLGRTFHHPHGYRFVAGRFQHAQ